MQTRIKLEQQGVLRQVERLFFAKASGREVNQSEFFECLSVAGARLEKGEPENLFRGLDTNESDGIS